MGRLVRAGLLLGFAALIGRLFATGDMAKYMSPTLDPLTGLAGLILAGMGGVELLRGADRAGGTADNDEHSFAADDGEHGGGDKLATVLLLILPLAIGLLLPPRALGASALGGEDISRTLLLYAPGPPNGAAGPPPPTAPIRDIPDLLGYLRLAGVDGVGQRARVLGMALPSRSLEPGEIALLRYSFAHCVADAQPLGLLVDAQVLGQQAATALASGGWIEVEGTIAVRERGGDRIVTIAAERVTPADEPPNPYLRGF